MEEVVCTSYLNKEESPFVLQGQNRGHLPAEADILTNSSWELNWICHYDFTAATQGQIGLWRELRSQVMH
jgi:hypothetical protein